MLNAEEESGLIRIRASGQLQSSDYDKVEPMFERTALREPGLVSMVIELAPDFSGWDLAGLWRKMKFDAKHQLRFGRIAIIGNKAWEEWGAKLTNPFFPSTEIRFFETTELSDAEAWARNAQGGARLE